jgi:hypothetical protein
VFKLKSSPSTTINAPNLRDPKPYHPLVAYKVEALEISNAPVEAFPPPPGRVVNGWEAVTKRSRHGIV